MQAKAKRIEGHYDVQEVPFGTVYRWHPKHSAVECGVAHEANIPGKPIIPRLTDEVLHPWRYAEERENAGLPC